MIKILILSLFTIFSFGNSIKICDDNAGWAPYAYIKNGKTDGFTVALSKQIFTRLNMKVQFDMIPWKRCLYMVKYFNKFHKYEIVADGTYNKEREKNYYRSLPIYQTNEAIFYSNKKFTKKQILNIIKTNVNSLKMCDVNGYQTEHYKKLLGYTNKIDKSAKNYKLVFKKILKNRCDAVLAPKEVVYGEEIMGQLKIPKGIQNAVIKKYKPFRFYLWVSKTSPRGKKLTDKINNTIKEIKKDGTYKKLYKKYILDVIK